MAKGQKRSTREIRKPKQDKSVVVKSESALGSQIKLANSPITTRGKSKG